MVQKRLEKGSGSAVPSGYPSPEQEGSKLVNEELCDLSEDSTSECNRLQLSDEVLYKVRSL